MTRISALVINLSVTICDHHKWSTTPTEAPTPIGLGREKYKARCEFAVNDESADFFFVPTPVLALLLSANFDLFSVRLCCKARSSKSIFQGWSTRGYWFLSFKRWIFPGLNSKCSNEYQLREDSVTVLQVYLEKARIPSVRY